MDESMPPLPPALPGGPGMSLGARLMNVFTGPGEVFEEVRKGPPSTGNWVVPALLSCLVGVVATFVICSQEAMMHQLREKQEQAIQKRLEKVPKEQREKILEAVEKWSSPAMMKISRSTMAVVFGFGWLFFMAVVLWLLGTKAFNGTFTFMQAAEACGLASMISVLGGVIGMLLAVVMGNELATPGPALLVHELDATNPVHLLLSACNVMTIWYLGVLAIGLARLSGASVAKAAVWLFAIWAGISTALILMMSAAQRLG